MQRRAAADVALADFDSVASGAEVDMACVVAFVDRAGIANHFRIVDRQPSGIVDVDVNS